MNSMLASLPQLRNVVFLCIFMFLLFGITGAHAAPTATATPPGTVLTRCAAAAGLRCEPQASKCSGASWTTGA